MLVVPVPLHRWRLWSRGFNQAALIARALGASLELPVELELLRRVKRTPALRGLNPSQSAKTVSGAFRIEPKDRARFTDRTVLLRSEERRVGKGGVSTCRPRWLTDT